MADGRGARGGQYLAGVGAVLLIVSLSLDWYRIELPESLRQAFEREVERFGLGGISDSVADLFGQSFGGTGWEVFSTTDIVLLCCAVAVLVLTAGAMGVAGPSVKAAAAGLARLTGLIGAVATGLVIVEMVNQPGPDELIGLEEGAYVALAAGVTITIGGWLAAER